ncbi:hypothetical protein JXA85_03605 [Candidatus Woesearchaeota archaeon]|nr:hypothetical protein [Candidatus Woesearchaeota archaeon]
MSKIKRIFTNSRVIVFLVFVLLAVIAIQPNFTVKGVAIRNVVQNSSAALANIQSPKPTDSPMSRERITAINNEPIKNIEEYYAKMQTLPVGSKFTLKTNKGIYKLEIQPLIKETILNETETKDVEFLNETTNVTEIRTITVPKVLREVIGAEDIGLSVYDAPTNNIKKGLDLTGGTRVLLQPEKELDQADMDTLIENMKQRLNVYGLSDVVVRESKDLAGNQYVLVEIAGANEGEVKDLLAKQGKFEAKIGNETVFIGGKDITYVARSADKAGIDPQRGCGQLSDERWSCRFRFAITLTPEAAQRQADLTKNLALVIEDAGEQYLSEKLTLYLDDALVDELRIGAELKGSAVTDIAISGSGVGQTRQAAIYDALQNMKRLQTILITGSLPVKIEIAQSNNISPILGEQFLRNALVVALVAFISVAVVISIRYKKSGIIVPMMTILFSEVILLLGLAALIGWNIDMAAIAGIIAAVGTGVDDQVVITDEVLRKEKTAGMVVTWKEKLKNAFFIIMGAYFTMVVAMLPLWFAGAGLLKGFAVTTIFGISFGVFVTRPAYAKMIEIILEEK